MKTRVAIVTPTITRPFQQYLDALEAEVPLLDSAGIEHGATWKVGSPYISAARAEMLRKALDWKADVIVFIDHDVSWRLGDLLKLIQADGDVVSGLYRFKKEEEEYMGTVCTDANERPMVRPDGCVKADRVPAGFLKVTKEAVAKFMKAYPFLMYGTPFCYSVDLFNHGAHEGVWWGEDYAFSRNWINCGGEILVVPDLNLTHHSADKAYPGNWHDFMLRQEGGSLYKEAA